MTSYTDVFGGSSVQPSDVQFRAVALSASITTVWPAFATTGNQCARIMKVTPSAGSLTVTLPDARLTSAGMDVLFDNPSATTFSVLDAASNVICTVAGGQVKYCYLSDNSTAAGTWRVTLFGVGASSVDAAQLAGYGLKALSSTINIAAVTVEIASSTSVTLADRSKVFVWVGGSGTLTLPSTLGSTSDFAIEVHNQGSGTLTVATTGGVLIDGSGTISMVVTESCFLHMGATDWYSVGRGRNTQFNFTQLNKTVTGGTTALTLTEAANVVQTYTGVLLTNQIINQPAVVQVYYVSNATTGAYTLTFGCVGGGTSVAVTQGQAAILFCDGTNIINANTSLAGGISNIVFGAGSAVAPSAAFASANTGFYSSASNEIGVSCNGAYMGKFTTGGFKAETVVGTAVSAISSGAAASLVASRPAGSVGSVRLQTAGVDRWALAESTTAEGGANAGSNFSLDAYSDAGALLGSACTVARSTQVVTFQQPPVMSGASITSLPLATAVTGALPVANGGTGAATLTGLLKGSGTSAFTAAVAGTDYQVPLVSGTNIKTINGNTLLGSGDLSISANSGGSTTTSSAVDMTLTAASTRVQLVAMTVASKKITLPDATTLTTGGQIFVITNNGALAFALRSNGGALVGSIQPAQTVICYLADNSTAAGIWALNEGTSNGVFSTPLPGTVTSVNAATVTGVGITALSPTLALIVYKENAGNIIARTLTISGTTITVNSATSISGSAGSICPVVAVSATQAVVCFTDSGGTNMVACTLNVSGTTVTAGVAIMVISGYAGSSAGIQKRSSTEVVINAGWSAVNVGVYPISISGTTLSLGTAAITGSGSVAINSFSLLTPTLGVHSMQFGATQTTEYGYVTFTGSVATLVGTYTHIDSPQSASDRLVTPSLAMLTATQFLTAGDQFMGAASPAIKVWLGEAPTNTGSPSFSGGITVAYAKDGSAAPKIQRITDTTAMLTWMGSAGFIYACEISVNGSSLTAGPVIALNAVSSSAPVICSLSSGAQVVAYIGTSSYAQAVVLENA